MGVLDHQKLKEVKASLKKGESLGRKLKEEGLASAQQLIQALKQQITHIIDMIFSEASGECLLQEGPLPNKVPTLKIKIMALLIRTITNLKSKDYLNTLPIDNPIQRTEAFESVCKNVEFPAQFDEFLEHIKTNEVIYANELCQDFHWDRRYTDDLFYILNLLGATDYQPQPETPAIEGEPQEDEEFTFSSISPDDFNEEPLHVIDDEEPLSDTAPSIGEAPNQDSPLDIDLEPPPSMQEYQSYNEVTVQEDLERPFDEELGSLDASESEADEAPGLEPGDGLSPFSEDEFDNPETQKEPLLETDEPNLPVEEEGDNLEDYSATTRKVLLEEDLRNYKGPLDIQFPEDQEKPQEMPPEAQGSSKEVTFSPNETQPVDVYPYDEPISGSSKSRRYLLVVIPALVILVGLAALYQMGMLTPDKESTTSIAEIKAPDEPANDTAANGDGNPPPEPVNTDHQVPKENESASNPEPLPAEPETTPIVDTPIDVTPEVPQSTNLSGDRSLDSVVETSTDFFQFGEQPFSIAIMLACERQTLEAFIAGMDLENIFITPRRYNGRDCYTLSWGAFGTYKEAASRMNEVPLGLKNAGQPWIKNLTSGL